MQLGSVTPKIFRLCMQPQITVFKATYAEEITEGGKSSDPH
jgi:hypothetical protein